MVLVVYSLNFVIGKQGHGKENRTTRLRPLRFKI
jgi:hypothetical protein